MMSYYTSRLKVDELQIQSKLNILDESVVKGVFYNLATGRY